MGQLTNSLRLAAARAFTPTLRVAATAAVCGLLMAGGALAAATPETTPATPTTTTTPVTSTASTTPAVDPAQTPPADQKSKEDDQKPKDNASSQPASQFSGVINAVGVPQVKGPDGKPLSGQAPNFDAVIFAPYDPAYTPFSITVVNPRDKAALALSAKKRFIPAAGEENEKVLAKRDRIVIDVDKPVGASKITQIVKIVRPVDPGAVAWTIFGVTAALLAVVYLASGGRPTRFITGHDGRMSNSQFQLALWFGVVAIAYGSMLLLRFLVLGADFIGGISLTNNVLMLTGLSAVTFGGAKLVATQKQDAAAAKAAENSTKAAETAKTTAEAAQTVVTAAAGLDATDPAAAKANVAAQEAITSAAQTTAIAAQLAETAANTPTAAEAQPKIAAKPRFMDLFQNGQGETDLGDFQMVLISVVAAGIFAVSSVHAMLMLHIATDITLPDVDSALLATFGLGQGAYLVKKAVLPPEKG